MIGSGVMDIDRKWLFEAAEIARFTETEMTDYEGSLKNLRDLGNVLDTAKEEGRKQGLKEGEKRKSIEIARKLLASGLPEEFIAGSTGLTLEEIQELKS